MKRKGGRKDKGGYNVWRKNNSIATGSRKPGERGGVKRVSPPQLQKGKKKKNGGWWQRKKRGKTGEGDPKASWKRSGNL